MADGAPYQATATGLNENDLSERNTWLQPADGIVFPREFSHPTCDVAGAFDRPIAGVLSKHSLGRRAILSWSICGWPRARVVCKMSHKLVPKTGPRSWSSGMLPVKDRSQISCEAGGMVPWAQYKSVCEVSRGSQNSVRLRSRGIRGFGETGQTPSRAQPKIGKVSLRCLVSTAEDLLRAIESIESGVAIGKHSAAALGGGQQCSLCLPSSRTRGHIEPTR